ncbi:inorganic phosphate transporter [Motilibacter sp. K478]|nr:inorganic phosphate transporter [Motilibacter aurantiacus]NHC47216.1 inorganic phosphate transporter [Motilibacter aurantiacus]
MSTVILPALLAPLAAGLVAGLGTYLAYRITSNVSENVHDKGFKVGQTGSASLVSLAHGTDDAQRTMGIIAPAHVAHGSLAEGSDPPLAST